MEERDEIDPAGAEDGRFLAVASEGAQIRALGALCAPENALVGLSPRSIIILAGEELTSRCAQLAVALAEPLTTPVTVVRRLPSYTGALDLVVAVGGADEHLALPVAVSTAARRGARTVVLDSGNGPLTTEAPADTVVVDEPHSYSEAPTFSPLRAVIGLLAVIGLAGDDAAVVERRLTGLADLIDEDLTGLAPTRGGGNEARQLRAFIGDSPVIHTAHDGKRAGEPWGMALACVIAALWTHLGLPATCCGIEDAVRLSAQTTGPDDIFHDPYLDGPQSGAPAWRTIVWASENPGMDGASAQDTADGGLGDAARAARLLVRALATTVLSDTGYDGREVEPWND